VVEVLWPEKRGALAVPERLAWGCGGSGGKDSVAYDGGGSSYWRAGALSAV
jgi:hypothetical protein